MQCNCCWSSLDSDDNISQKHVVTPCLHLYCLGCAQKLLNSDACCNVCQAPFSQNEVKVVQLLQKASKHTLSLCGQTPEVIMQTALTAIQFYIQQQGLSAQYKESRMDKRMQALHTQCNEKLQQVHQAYTKAKQKAATLAAQSNDLKQERDELAAKYQQRSSQFKQLKEQVKQYQQQGQPQQEQQQMGMMQPSNMGMGMQMGGVRAMSPTGGNGGMGQMVTTVQQRTAVFNMPDSSTITPPMMMQMIPSGNGTSSKRRQSMGGMPLLGGSADLSPGHAMGMQGIMGMQGMQSGQRRASNNENMMKMSGGMGKMSGGGGQMMGSGSMGMGNVLQNSNRPNFMMTGLPHGFTTSM